MRASEVANMMAAPTPWTPRKRMSISELVDSPHSRDEREKMASPMA